ncbi:MAG: alpha/beta hydrolase [Rhodospirillaceae bacterium]|nr:alpha/beta hydrolase [Rhodospirillaceae bacterium]
MPLGPLFAILAAALMAQAAAAADGSFLDIPGGRIAYESGKPTAASETVILIDDGTLDSAVWNGVFPILCEKFHTVRFDLRGYGNSPQPTERYSPVDDIRHVMSGLRIKRAALVGASANGGRALAFTLAHPEAVDALVLIGPSISGVPSSESFIKEVMPFVERLAKNDRPGAIEVAEKWRHLVAPANAAAMQELRALLKKRAQTIQLDTLAAPGESIVERLGEIKARILVIAGEFDHPNNLNHSKVAHEKIPGSSFIMMKDSAHLPFLEHPAEFADVVVKFLQAKRR